MSQLLLVGNPIKGRRKAAKKRTTAKRKASPAQLRARAKFAAMARARSKTSRTKRAAPKRKSRRTSLSLRSNPIVAKRRSPKRKSARSVSRRTRRNPISGRGITSSLLPALKSAGLGAAGAIGVDAIYGMAQQYLPDSVKSPVDAAGSTNYMYYAAKGAAAFAVAMGLRKVVGANKAAAVLQGSLTVTLHDMAKSVLAVQVPSMTMGRYIGVQQGSLGNSPGGRVVRLPSSSLQKYTSGVGSSNYGTTARMRESAAR